LKVVSINVGRPRSVAWQGRRVRTGIFKEPVEGRVRVERLNLAGDGQADLRVHGGEDKAVYAYPAAHYPIWSAELGRSLPYGQFGENLTLEGISEEEARIGDRYRIGSAVLEVSQPRVPCFKLGIRMEDDAFPQRFLESGRSGFYLRVAIPGEVGAGDEVVLELRDAGSLTVAQIQRLTQDLPADPAVLVRAAELAALPAPWRQRFRRHLAEASRDRGR
jgi:MOSC domain-containing protein YiiM